MRSRSLFVENNVMGQHEHAAMYRWQVHAAVRLVLGADIGIHDPLMAAGLDSLAATELRSALQRVTGVPLPATMVFDHPTVAAMTARIAAWLTPEGVTRIDASPSAQPHIEGRFAAAELLAVTASDMRLPCCGAVTLRAVDTCAVVPLQRWDAEALQAIEGGAVR